MDIAVITWIQQFHNPFLDAFFQGITMLGEELVLIPLLTILYWAVNKNFGEKLAFTIFANFLLNNSLKELFSFDRPIGEEGVRTLRPETATGKAFPSGHSQNGAATFGALALQVKKRWFTLLTIILIVLIGLSRLYLGVHYPKDVFVGILLGLFMAKVSSVLFEKMDKTKLYLLVLLLFIPAWAFSFSLDFIKSFASYLGFFLGILLEKKVVQFSVEGSLFKKILRVLLGIALVLLIKEGLKVAFPETHLFDFIRYFLLTFVAIGVYPWLFQKLRL